MQINSSVPSLGVYLEGETVGVKLARQALESVSTEKLVREVNQQNAATFRILAGEQKYFLTRSTNSLLLSPPVEGYTLSHAQKVIQSLEHITRWHYVKEITNSASKIANDAIQIEIYQGEQAIPLEDVSLNYQYVNGEWIKPSFRVKLTNQSSQSLYCALIVLSESYKIETRLLSGVWLEPKQSYWTRKVNSSLAQKSPQQKVTKRQDILKLMICTQDFDVTLLHQNALTKLTYESRQTRDEIKQLRNIPLNRLLQKIHKYPVEFTEEESADWKTSQIVLTTIRPHTPEPTFELNVLLNKHQAQPLQLSVPKPLPEQRIFSLAMEEHNYTRLVMSLLAGVVTSLAIFGFLFWQYYPQEKAEPKQNNGQSPVLNQQENLDESSI